MTQTIKTDNNDQITRFEIWKHFDEITQYERWKRFDEIYEQMSEEDKTLCSYHKYFDAFIKNKYLEE